MQLYIIPAYGETIKNRGYKKIISEAKKKKYEVKVLNLQIKGKLLSELTQKGVEKIGTNVNRVIFGFSTGALIAYNISTVVPVKKLVLASISPVLGIDIKNISLKITRLFGKKTVEELKKLHYKKSKAKEIVFLYGDKETGLEEDFLISRTKKLYRAFKGKKKLIEVKNTDHNLNSVYIGQIVNQL